MSDLSKDIQQAVAEGHLLASSAKNIELMLGSSSQPCVRESIQELVSAGAWQELDDRFYKTLTFGTGGLRGRTIGRIVTASEQGAPQTLGRPEQPCIGTNAMNSFNVSRATQGLVAYLKDWVAETGLGDRPKIVIAHDTRFFSPEFTQLAARVAMENGCDVCLFEGPRSTPQLSFAVRHQNATGGIVEIRQVPTIGVSDHRPVGDNEYGSNSPLPIWMDFMKAALEGVPEETRQQPSDVVTLKIDPRSGEPAPPDQQNAMFEYFLADHAPTNRPTNQTNTEANCLRISFSS